MNRKTILTVVLISFLLEVVLVEESFVEEARANFSPKNPIITINSPVPGQTYNTTSITINVSVRTDFDYFNDSNNGAGSRTITYSQDEQKPVKMVDSFKSTGLFSISTAEKTITDLTNGMHTLEITATNDYSAWNPNFVLTGKKDIFFFVNAVNAYPPNPTPFLPLNPTKKPSLEPTPTIKPSPQSTSFPSPTPSPTLSTTIAPSSTPSPIPPTTTEPTSTPKQPSGFLGTNLSLEYGYAIVAVLVIAVVAGLSLVYWKKRRK